MSAESDLLALLTGHGPLTALVGSRIHRDMQPEGGEFPCVVFVLAQTDPVVTIGGDKCGDFASFDIAIGANNGADALAVQSEVEAALLAAGEVPTRSGGYDAEAGMHVYSVNVTLLAT